MERSILNILGQLSGIATEAKTLERNRAGANRLHPQNNLGTDGQVGQCTLAVD